MKDKNKTNHNVTAKRRQKRSVCHSLYENRHDNTGSAIQLNMCYRIYCTCTLKV